MKNLILALAAVSVAAMLGACGGGSDGDPASAGASAAIEAAATTTTPTSASTDTAAKYAGTWGGCFSTGSASASFSFTQVNFTALACAGTAGSTSTDSGTIAFSGSKTIAPTPSTRAS